MTRSGLRRARITAGLAAACLVASASALAIGGYADWSAPPRFDGAGYAVLARAWLTGQGHRAIDHPDRPPHAHFPPGYPLVLALTWSVTGTSVRAAHVVSGLCTLGATLAAWWWFRRLMSCRAAFILGLALAVNWLWARTGGAIQSEPLYMLLGQVTIVAAVETGRRTALGKGNAIALGALLACCMLTRHVAIGLTLAVLLDMALRRRWPEALTVATVAAIVVSPWLSWMAVVGSSGRTQAGLLVQGGGTWAGRIGRQLMFYAQRIPDQLTGPFVEVGTVFQRSPYIAIVAQLWAVLATGVIVGGWIRVMRRPRSRLAGLIPVLTLGILFLWPYTEAGRLLIPLIPCLLIGAVEGLGGLVSRLARSSGRRLRRSRLRFYAATLLLATSLPYSGYLMVTGRTRAPEATHRDFDAACTWIAAHAQRSGPVLSRHPGEVFWRTGRQGLEAPSTERPGDLDADAGAIARTIEAYRVAYLLIDQERYAHAPSSPLARFVAEHEGQVRKVWGRETERSAVTIYEVIRAR
ncbi:MAG: ArnT family glycosyltransferase [Isosphaerales bacterium]